ncbi:rhomboid family intramembrane serine protease [Psychrobacter sp. FDAARGOS_221]|uniref:rhomboid family intramembrane serine protease n=1 Tax=Psychrobacter sp. FDAARGOS_221 TaxID=1975705 RepID=UPI000BB592D7|nr:rhomboid family intramembrane serine protease [Psychrobacter sp. FDAARGOS_221]PNK60437.1 rhomboid family intramembrane serine protease [Psychrobacter sp. FDAARGOS_221]
MNSLLSSHTTLIIIITVIVSLMAWQNKGLMDRLIFSPIAVNKGQWYRLITHGFVHADSTHLLFNMFTLYFFGRAVENYFNQYLGGFGFIAVYLAAIIVAMLPSYMQHKDDFRYRSLGASGGVSAVLFSFILMAPWSMLYLFAAVPIPAIVFAIAYVAYSIYANNKGNTNVNHLAHLWGGAFGVIATILLSPNMLLHFFNALMHPRF